jgi:hypothetical protein
LYPLQDSLNGVSVNPLEHERQTDRRVEEQKKGKIKGDVTDTLGKKDHHCVGRFPGFSRSSF